MKIDSTFDKLANELQKILAFPLPKFSPAKKSIKPLSVIKAFAANSASGIIRTYNEDRVSIVINIAQDSNKKCAYWPKCFLFAIYDGHGGTGCSDFLRDNLHNDIIQSEYFPLNPRLAIQYAINKIEKQFCSYSMEGKMDKSGSCLVLALIVGKWLTRDNKCYVANVGDSRALKSSSNGKIIQQITTDHKPMNNIEMKRIIANGGKIYQAKTNLPVEVPYRVLPGRLSVSRTIGDIEAKYLQFDGNPKVVIAEPDIFEFEITDQDDFLFLGCDGIFDCATNEEIINFMWLCKNNVKSIHEQAADMVDGVIKLAAYKESYDNLTGVLIAFNGFASKELGRLSDYEESTIDIVKPTIRINGDDKILKKEANLSAEPQSTRRIIQGKPNRRIAMKRGQFPFIFPRITISRKSKLLFTTKNAKTVS